MMRYEARHDDQLRPIQIARGFTRSAPGSVLIQSGRTTVLCTASVSDRLPAWREAEGLGWITSEYNMLPGSTTPRKPRDRGGKVDGRSTEIGRLIGRSLRAVADFAALGPRVITVDCDVLEADGGTRTTSTTGALVALVDAIRSIDDLPDPTRFPLRDTVAAVSVGLVDRQVLLDLDYREDAAARVDMNVVMTGRGQFVEIQAGGEEATFDDDEFGALVDLSRNGIGRLVDHQREALGAEWPFA